LQNVNTYFKKCKIFTNMLVLQKSVLLVIYGKRLFSYIKLFTYIKKYYRKNLGAKFL